MILLKDYIHKDQIVFLEDADKTAAIQSLVRVMVKSPNILDAEKFEKAVFERESIVSTGIGLGIAIPHVKIDSVKDMTVVTGISEKGIPWDAIDNLPVHVILLIGGSKEQHTEYLRLLSKFILVLKKQQRRQSLIKAGSASDVLTVFSEL